MSLPLQGNAYELMAYYSMEDLNPWNGSNGELSDSAGYAGGPFNGRATGNPLPTSDYALPAKIAYPLSTCAYSQHAGPANNGGAFLINNLPVNTNNGSQQSMTFWMYWNGTDGVVPIGWSNYKLIIKNNRFGFDANDGRIYGVSANGLANGWHHISAVFTNINMAANSLYIDGNLQSLTFTGTQSFNAAAAFNPDTAPSVIPPSGWFTDNPSRTIEINPAAVYGVSGSSTTYMIEVENYPGDYNLYALITPNKGEQLTLSLDYAARSGYTSGTNSAIDVYLDNIFISRINTQLTQIRHFDIPLGFATGNAMRVEFRSVDRDSLGGLLTNIKVLQNQAVATSSFAIGGYGSSNTMRFAGRLDEVKIYKDAINQSQAQNDFNFVHVCNRLNYLQIVHPGQGISCMPAQVQIRSCTGTDSNGQCMAAAVNVSGYLNAVDRGNVVSSQPFNIAQGSPSTSISLPIPVSQNVNFTLSNLSRTPDNSPLFVCANQMNNTDSCTYISNQAGFIVANQPNGSAVNIASQQAGIESATYYLRAVTTNTQTGACQAALAGANSIDFGYVCTNPTTCSAGNRMRMTGRAAVFIAANHQANNSPQYTVVPMTFDSDGNAPFSLNFFDVGQTTLAMRKTINAIQLTGSNTFTTKPDHLEISSITDSANVANPAASNASGPKFVVAGRPFKLTVAAYAANNQVTPNFGRETQPENIVIQPSLVTPAGGNAGQLINNTTLNGDFTNGIASMTSISWNEVGIINLIPRLADSNYLSAGNVTGVTSANVGRFYPNHFTVGALTSTPACSGQFSYFGQDGLLTNFQINAFDVNGNITQNYTGLYGTNSFAKLNIASYPAHGFSLSPVGFSLYPKVNGPTGVWVNGRATVNASHYVIRPNAATPVTNLTVLAKPTDDDGVTAASATAISTPSPFRYGRFFLPPAHGSELLPLPLQIESQYWTGAAYVRSLGDSCTVIPLSSIVMKNFKGNLSACETHLTGNANLNNGLSGIKLTAPGVGSDSRPNSGSVDVEVNLGNVSAGEQTCLSMLQTAATSGAIPWFGADPTARASFGLYKSPVIYFRENF